MSNDNFDDYDFDDDSLDFGENDPFNMEDSGTPPKDDRSPIVKTSDAAITTLGEELKKTDRYIKTIDDNLPQGYRSVAKHIDDVASTGKELVDEASKELKPALTQLKRNTKRMMPMLRGVMPESISNRLDSLLSEDDSVKSAARLAEESDDNAITTTLGDIFKAQAETDGAAAQEDLARKTIRENVEDAQTRTSMSVKVDMLNQLTRLNAFNDNINAKVARQSLELRFRNYFAVRDLLSVTKRASADTVEKLSEIVKNTGLPDIVKFRQSEAFMQQFKDNLYGDHIEGIKEKAAPFTERLKKTVVGKVRDKIGGYREAIEQGSEMASQLADADEMAKEAGIELDPTELTGQFAANTGLNKLFNKVGLEFGKMARSNETIARTGDLMERMASDPEGTFRSLADADDETIFMGIKVGDSPFLSALRNGLGNIDPGKIDERESIILNANSTPQMMDPIISAELKHRAIVEIIPDYLARILEQTTLRNDPNAERMVYNTEKGRITTMSDAVQGVQKKASNAGNDHEYAKNVRAVVDDIDRDNTLSANDREFLALYLTQVSGKRQLFDAEELYRGLNSSNYESLEQKESVQAVLADAFGGDKDGNFTSTDASERRQLRASRKFNKLRKHERVGQDVANEAKLKGTIGTLAAAGLVKDTENGYVWNNDAEEVTRRQAIVDVINSENPNAPRVVDAPITPVTSAAPTPLPGLDKVSSTVIGNYSSNENTTTVGGNTYNQTQVVGNSNAVEDINSLNQSYLDSLPDYAANALNREFPEDTADESEESPLVQEYITSMRDNTVAIETTQETTHELLDKLITKNSEGFAALLGATENLTAVDGGTSSGKLFGKVGGLFGKGISKLTKTTTGLAGGVFNIAKRTTELVTSPFTSIYTSDIYLKGDPTGKPILTKAKLLRGDYFNPETGKVITSFRAKNLRYGVKDSEGNYVVTPEQVEQGLTRVNGKSISLKAIKLAGKVADVLTLGIFGKTKKRLKSIGKVLGQVSDKIKNLAGSRMETDIFVFGDTEPRLRLVDLKAGKYRSKLTGKIITSFALIDGPVLDSEGNEVLSEDDLDRLRDVNGKTLRLAGLIGSALRLSLSPLKLITKPVGLVKDKIHSMLDEKYRGDIMVIGSTDVKLSYQKMKEGAYYHKATGKPLTSFSDIRGEIIDSSGNVVLSEDDIKAGLVNPKGETIPTDNLLVRGIGTVGKLIKGVGKAAKFVKDKTLGGMKTVRDKLLGLFGFSPTQENLNEGVLSIKTDLVRIRADVVNIYTDGPINRFGSNGPDTPTTPSDDSDGSFSSTVTNYKDTATESVKDFVSSVSTNETITNVTNKVKRFTESDSVKDVSRTVTNIINDPGNVANKAYAGVENIASKITVPTVTVVDTEKLTDTFTGAVKDLKETLTSKLSPKKKVGDSDGDGDRDGSYLDMTKNKIKAKADKMRLLKERRAEKHSAELLKETKLSNKLAKKNNKYAKTSADNSGGLMDTLIGWGPAVLGAIGTLGTTITTAIMGLMGKKGAVDALDAVSDGLIDGKDGKPAGSKKPGTVKRILGFAKRNIGKVATAGLGLAKSTLVAAGTAVAGVGAATVGTVVLGATAVAAVGYGAYQGYKALHRRKEVSRLEAVRFAQYGINQNDSDAVVAIRYLEEELIDDVSPTAVSVEIYDATVRYADDFGIPEYDELARASFTEWLAKRFLPVLQTWQRVTKVHGTDAINAHEDLGFHEQVDVARGTMYTSRDSDSPYSVLSPFPVPLGTDNIEEALEELTMSSGSVQATSSTKPLMSKEKTSNNVIELAKRKSSTYRNAVKRREERRRERDSMQVNALATGTDGSYTIDTSVSAVDTVVPVLGHPAPPPRRNAALRAIAEKRKERMKATAQSNGKTAIPLELTPGLLSNSTELAESMVNTILVNESPGNKNRPATNIADERRAGIEATHVTMKQSEKEEAREERELERKLMEDNNGLQTLQLSTQASINNSLQSLLGEVKRLREDTAKVKQEPIIIKTETTHKTEDEKQTHRTENKVETKRVIQREKQEVIFPISTGKSNLQLGE